MCQQECSKWMHADCASKNEEGSSVCIICGAIFQVASVFVIKTFIIVSILVL